MMQVAGGTLSPWVSMPSWLSAKPQPLPSAYSELVRMRLDRERERYRDRLHHTGAGGLTFYAYGPYGRKPQSIFRIDGYPGGNRERVGTGPDGAAAAAGWDRYPLQQYNPLFGHSAHDISRIPEINLYGTRQNTAEEEWKEPRERPRGPEQRPGARAVPSRGRYGDAPLTPRGALRAWLFASALVILVVLVVRTIDKCLDLNLLKHRRRSQEWPTPSVRATSRQATDSSIPEEPSSTELRPVGQHIDVFSVDLPPPYSECLRDERVPDPGLPKTEYEEPPPGYNEIYVEFSNKNGAPVVICRRRTPLVIRREIAGSHSENIDNEATSEPFNNAPSSNSADNSTVGDRDETSDNVQDQDNVMNDLPSTSGETVYIDMENNSQDTDIDSEDTNEQRVIMV